MDELEGQSYIYWRAMMQAASYIDTLGEARERLRGVYRFWAFGIDVHIMWQMVRWHRNYRRWQAVSDEKFYYRMWADASNWREYQRKGREGD